MTPRGLLTTIGATALGFGIVIGGGTAAQPTSAQESPPAIAAPADRFAEMEQARAEAYDAFVAALASELGADESDVDTAIREALKAQLAQMAGEESIDADVLAELERMIDVSEAPLPIGHLGPGGRGGMHPFKGGHVEGRGDGRGPRVEIALPGLDEEGGAARPSDDEAADQETPVDDVTAEEGAAA